MITILPIAITDAILTSTNIAEPDVGEFIWDAGTPYALGDVRIRKTTHKKYENILAGTDAGLPENTPLRWIEVGSTNRYAMFDTLRNTQTVSTSPLTVTITPGLRTDAVSVMAMDGDTVNIKVINESITAYDYTQTLSTREVYDWYDYFFEPFTSIASIVKFDLPPYTTGSIVVTITSADNVVKCGAVVIGNQSYLGAVEYNAISDEPNFSRIEREFDGTATLIPRRSIPKTNQTLFTDKTLINKIRATRRALNAVPTVFSGLDDKNTDGYFEALLILGIYKRFEIDIGHPTTAKINLEIEEI